MGKLIKKYKSFTQVPNTVIEDSRLSYRAKGLYVHLVSKPDNWVYYVKEFEKASKDGRESVRSGLKELEKYDYLVRVKSKNNYGKFTGWDYYIYDTPTDGISDDRKNLPSKKPTDGSMPPNNIKSTKTELNNTDYKCETREAFKKYIRECFVNKDILTSKDKNTGQLYIISVDFEGKLYDKKGMRFNAKRSLEMWDTLFEYYRKHILDFQQPSNVSNNIKERT